MQRIMASNAPASVVLMRLLWVEYFFPKLSRNFFFQMIWVWVASQKSAFRRQNFTGPFVSGVEIVCGALILVGRLTRLAAIPLIIDMLVAITTTKVPIMLARGFWRFSVSKLPSYGFWAMAREARVDFAMLLGSLFLLIVGAGAWSIAVWLCPEISSRISCRQDPAILDRHPHRLRHQYAGRAGVGPRRQPQSLA